MVPDVSNGFIGRKSTQGFVILYRAEGVPHEYLLPDTRDGPLTLCFPYVLTRERVGDDLRGVISSLRRLALMAAIGNEAKRRREFVG